MWENKKEKIIIIALAILLVTAGVAGFFFFNQARKTLAIYKEAQEKLLELTKKTLSKEDLCFQTTNKLAEESCNKILTLSTEECSKDLNDLLCRKFLRTEMMAEIPAVKSGQETNFKEICKLLVYNPYSGIISDEKALTLSPSATEEFCNQTITLIEKGDRSLCESMLGGQTNEEDIQSCQMWINPGPELCDETAGPAHLSNCLGKVSTIKSFYENNPDYCKEIANYEDRALCLFFHKELDVKDCSDIYSGKENFFKIVTDQLYCK